MRPDDRSESESGPARSPVVEVVRSSRRRRTVSASRQGDRIVVRVPAGLASAEVDRWVSVLVKRVIVAEAKTKPTDELLARRARELSDRYLAGRAHPRTVRWVDNQNHRWGSCTPADGSIRLSRRVSTMPSWVRDAVLLHELAHLIEPGHGPAFRNLVANFPDAKRADAFLAGWAAADAAAGRTPQN